MMTLRYSPINYVGYTTIRQVLSRFLHHSDMLIVLAISLAQTIGKMKVYHSFLSSHWFNRMFYIISDHYIVQFQNINYI